MLHGLSVIRTTDALAVLLLAAFPFFYFYPVTLGQSVWYTTDILRLTYPFALESQHNLIPLWTDKILMGFPLFAEGQVAALYPLNLLLLRTLPAHVALSLGVLIHLASGACGMYLFVRTLGLRSPSALLAGFIFSFNGWVFGHLSHVGVIAAISWLPWSLYFLTRFQKSRSGIWFAFIAFAFAMMYLSGSVQLAFLNSLAFLALGAMRVGAEASPAPTIVARAKEVFLSVALPFLLGLGIAAVQLVPTLELVGYSVRSATDANFSTSFSLPKEFLQQLVAPFFQGEPSEGTGEYWGYIGFAPLLFAILASWFRRDRRTIFFAIFALVALSLALGANNPLFFFLYRLPIFGFFRVPARYLYLFTFAAAICAASGLDALADRLPVRTLSRFSRYFASFALLPFAILVVYLAHTQPLETWLVLWRVLPFVLGTFSFIILALAFKQKIARENFIAFVLGITLLDLTLYAPPFLKTIDELSPVTVVGTQPRSLPIFRAAPTRVYTDISVFPSVPSLRASMYPNIGMVYGVPSAQAYTSLSFGRHEAYLSQASPAMLNLLNARWFAVPLEPRPSGNRLTPPENFYLALRDETIAISPTLASAVEISSFTEQAEKLADGTSVAEIEISFRDGTAQKFPLRVGIETADWDYARKTAVAHKLATIAHSFPAFWRAFGKPFDGHTYLARFDFASGQVTSARLRVLDPNVQFDLERITLLDARAQPKPLATLANKNNFTLAYLSDTVAVWENQDVLPRAFIAHGAEITDDSAAFARMQDNGFEPRSTVWLSEGRALPRGVIANDEVEITQSESERVTVTAETTAAGYVVLGDSWYPGWNASVDGKPALIYRADVIFRAVPIEAGRHTIVFEYQPLSLSVGIGISAVSAALTIGISFALRRKNNFGV